MQSVTTVWAAYMLLISSGILKGFKQRFHVLDDIWHSKGPWWYGIYPMLQALQPYRRRHPWHGFNSRDQTFSYWCFKNKRVKECQKEVGPCLKGRWPYRQLEEVEACSSWTWPFGGLKSDPEPSKGSLHRGCSVIAAHVSECDHRACAHHWGALQMYSPGVWTLALLPWPLQSASLPPRRHQGNQKKQKGEHRTYLLSNITALNPAGPTIDTTYMVPGLVFELSCIFCMNWGNHWFIKHLYAQFRTCVRFTFNFQLIN